jgi:hypothetical protein
MNTEIECWTNFQSMVNAFRESIHDNVKGEYDQVASMDFTEFSTASADVEVVSNDDMDSDVKADESEEREELLTDDMDSDVEADESEEQEELLTDENEEDHIAYHIYHLQRTFQSECKKSFTNFLTSQYHKIVLRKIDRTAGVSLPNFPNRQIIVGLFRKELQKLTQCCRKVVDGIHGYMSRCLLRLFHQAFNKDYPRLQVHLKEVIIKQLNEVKEVLLKRVLEILDMERRVFTLNLYYMDTVNKLKEKDKKKNDDHNRSSAASAPFSGSGTTKTTSVSITKNSTGTVTYASVSNKAQAARDIQIALHAYSKVIYST